MYFCDELQAPWEMPFVDKHQASFHHVRRGHCEVEFGDYRAVLSSGDLLFVGRGEDHMLRSEREAQAPTLLLCGYFRFGEDLPAPLLNLMPSCLVVREEELLRSVWLKQTLDHLSDEYRHQQPGAEVVVNKLTEVLLIELIRCHLHGNGGANFVTALTDRHIGPALGLLHAEPHAPWTLENLAARVSLSRSAFAGRFSNLVGQPMFQYLTDLRVRRACELLRGSGLSVAEIAERVGYSSDLAFTRVFKSARGMTPSAYRRGRVPGDGRSVP